jgi:transposase
MDAVTAAANAHPDKTIALYFQDEARVGQKGRTGHRWWIKGQRPPGLCDKRFDSAYIFAAVRPANGDQCALVLPEVSTEAMSVFLGHFAATLAPDVHAVVVLDQAGWHGAKALYRPPNVSLAPLPAYSPDLNPVERVWLHLRERYLSHRLLDDYEAVVTASCDAWNALVADSGRIHSLCNYPYLQGVSS